MPFQTPGSGSGPALSALAPPNQLAPPTHLGYASAAAAGATNPNDVSYPRFDVNDVPSELAGEDLRPGRRGLVIAVVVLGAGVVALVIALISSSSGTRSNGAGSAAAIDPSSDASLVAGTAGAAGEPGSGAAIAPSLGSANDALGASRGSASVGLGSAHAGSTTPKHDPKPLPTSVAATSSEDDGMIAVHVAADPGTGAEVLLDGKHLGVTPLDIKIRRGTGMATLLVRSSKYGDATARVDTTGDFSKQMTLHKDDSSHDTTHTQPPKPPTTTKPKCQQPGPNMDPYTPICSK